VELSKQVDWPLNIVITESCLSKYSGIFSFLLQLKLMMWTLKDVCFHLKRTGESWPSLPTSAWLKAAAHPLPPTSPGESHGRLRAVPPAAAVQA
jgi:hypothetical protein